MPYTQIQRLRRVVTLGTLALVGLTPMMAQAQFKVNNLFGKTFPEVSKMLGKPLTTAGNPTNYSRFQTPGAVNTTVWYFFDTGTVSKILVEILGKPGDTEAQILKKYGLSVGANPRTFQVKPPGVEHASIGAVPGMPWTKIFIGYMYVMPFQTEATKYCKEHHLDPGSTYFWNIQVTTLKPSGGRMMGTATDGGGGGHKKGKKGGKGKG